MRVTGNTFRFAENQLTMTANELRIGNYFYDSEFEIFTVEEICKYQTHGSIGVRFRSGGSWGSIEVIEPIPLTEEWLVKLGLENKNEIITDSLGRYYLLRCQGVQLRYVHQLQNLYFAITGEELTIKNK